MTIVIRIDTLETPTLEPRTIGFCALRLCVDNLGMQPLSEVLFDGKPSCFYNVGEFDIPILYGLFPSDIPFVTEAKFQESLPPIPGAYLKIRMSATQSTGTSMIVPSTSLDFARNASSMNMNSAQPSRKGSAAAVNTPIGRMSGKQASMKGGGGGGIPSIPVLRMSSAILMVNMDTNKDSPKSMKDTVNIYCKSVSSALLKSYLTNKNRLSALVNKTPLLIETDTLDNFRKGNPIDPFQRQSVVVQLTQWVQAAFEESEIPKLPVNSKYLLEYNEDQGVLAALDMLYNMPDRKKLIAAAENAASVAAMKTGMSNRWDNKINCFKTVFRYLPGALTSFRSLNDGGVNPSNGIEFKDNNSNNNNEKMASPLTPGTIGESLVIDDASVKLSLNSVEQCPAYLDEFSCTVGMKLGPHACLLVVVTAVDVLTSKKAQAIPQNSHSTRTIDELNSAQSPQPVSMLSPSDSRASLFSYDDITARQEKAMRQQKLKGLKGIHVGSNDPKATWWGLVKLFTKYPATAPANGSSSSSANTSVDQNNNTQTNTQSTGAALNNNNITPPDTAVNHTNGGNRMPSSSNLGRGGNADHSEALTIQGTDNGMQTSFDAMLSSLSSLPLFANYGTHQIPLFQGIPPDEMIHSPDPLAWVISRLNYQIAHAEINSQISAFQKFMLTVGSCFQHPSRLLFGGAAGGGSSTQPNSRQNSNRMLMDSDMLISSSKSTIDTSKSAKTSKKGKKKKKKTEELVLSSGSSAFIRIVDPRIKRLAGNPIATETNREITSDQLNEIITIQSHSLNNDESKNNGIISLQLNPTRMKTLKQDFQFQPQRFHHKRTLKMAIPESVEAQALIAELNTKFYQSLST
jgi:hypothetical protein